MSLYKVHDMKDVVLELFYKEAAPEHRYASFDYCYNYFQKTSIAGMEADIEKACLELSFYLASWGMLRGSSFLLQKSSKYYEPLIKYFIELKYEKHNIWKLDVPDYSDRNNAEILEIYEQIKQRIIDSQDSRHIVLVTKIMLGVFGCIPAFDTYFTNTFRDITQPLPGRNGFRTVNSNSLNHIQRFYVANSSEIEELRNIIHTIDFKTGKPTVEKYSCAKIIDMYGFAKSFY